MSLHTGSEPPVVIFALRHKSHLVCGGIREKNHSLHHGGRNGTAVLYGCEWRGQVGGVGCLHHLFIPVHHIQITVELLTDLLSQLKRNKICSNYSRYSMPCSSTYFRLLCVLNIQHSNNTSRNLAKTLNFGSSRIFCDHTSSYKFIQIQHFFFFTNHCNSAATSQTLSF